MSIKVQKKFSYIEENNYEEVFYYDIRQSINRALYVLGYKKWEYSTDRTTLKIKRIHDGK